MTRTTRNIMLSVLASWFTVSLQLPVSVSAGSVNCEVPGQSEDIFSNYSFCQTRLPAPISDHTATLHGDKVYIAGGCDSPTGNEFVPDFGFFRCSSITDSFGAFDVETQLFAELSPMPVSRYRHTASVVDGQIWVVGGRDVNDNLVSSIEVYDIATGVWNTHGALPDEYQVSDHATFALDRFIYIMGGFIYNYEAKKTAFRIDTTSVMRIENTSTLILEEVAPLLEARGDTVALLSDDGQYAFVSGGNTHLNSFCEPLDSVERYDVKNDVWEAFEHMKHGRAGEALVEVESHLFALGGERAIENFCEIKGDIDPANSTVAVVGGEAYWGGKWHDIGTLPEYRFRFAAVGYPPTNSMYTFGGQGVFNESCLCYPTTSDIVIYKEVKVPEHFDSGVAPRRWNRLAALATTIGLLILS